MNPRKLNHPLEIGTNVGVDLLDGGEMKGFQACVLDRQRDEHSGEWAYYLELYVGQDPTPKLWFFEDVIYPL